MTSGRAAGCGGTVMRGWAPRIQTIFTILAYFLHLIVKPSPSATWKNGILWLSFHFMHETIGQW